MGSVTNTLIDGQGRGLNEVTVRISLIAPLNPFLLDGTGECIQKVAVDTDHDGSWTATLAANDTYEASDTYYLVDETDAPHGMLWTIRMPDGDDTYTLRSLLITPPGNNGTPPFQYSLDDLTDVVISDPKPGDVLTYSSSDDWVNAPQQVQRLEYPVNSPTTPWVWQHNLGRTLVVDVYDGQGNKVVASVQQPDGQKVIVTPGAPMVGRIEAR